MHTPEWLARKSRQAAQEKIDEHRIRIVENFKGLALFIDLAFNQGREADQILPSLYEEERNLSQADNPYIETMWWKYKKE
ncbi:MULTISPECIES: hypothetical protein [unclassified Thermoactinomyces]|uniref:hypothetical protein n=1 Tax=unclassified Thermoactinomyces TaxID=2634588 RepID=UPI0018DEB75E|nr:MULTISPECIES: hypothetical protein [unclassified Thermoactinomyces]MBH8599068.1 hypothetical protein [Thermoactinomyces sp. CICC 10523]MBH8608001.1 hypothetical protein [Thermoactinomyces sp. CICC 10521]